MSFFEDPTSDVNRQQADANAMLKFIQSQNFKSDARQQMMRSAVQLNDYDQQANAMLGNNAFQLARSGNLTRNAGALYSAADLGLNTDLLYDINPTNSLREEYENYQAKFAEVLANLEGSSELTDEQRELLGDYTWDPGDIYGDLDVEYSGSLADQIQQVDDEIASLGEQEVAAPGDPPEAPSRSDYTEEETEFDEDAYKSALQSWRACQDKRAAAQKAGGEKG